MDTKVALIIGVLVIIVSAVLWATTDINVGALALAMVAVSALLVGARVLLSRRQQHS